ncbi:hypothetical protein QVD17_23169 [Tagetes erecta]|uniref:Uncharacterized protein n=1 Tax=Tagetes erecta TaxID=13708 RepID=A0AAD8NM31_TARER|nr:hypothetical protein QVD17_23169 [Tagetes erecta]
MVFVALFTSIQPSSSSLFLRSDIHQLCPTFPPTSSFSTPIHHRRIYSHNRRRWDSNADTFRTKNYHFNNEEFEEDEDDDDMNQWLDVLEDFVDGVWIFKAFKSYGWMLPAIISSLLLANGPKAFLMALAIPMGQSALSLLFQTVWGRPHYKTRSRGKSKTKPPPRATSYMDIEDGQEEYVKGERTAGAYQTWVAGVGGSSDNKTNGSSLSFGGWEELDGRNQSSKYAKPKKPMSKMGRRQRRSDTPLLLRLLIAVFPFLGTWTRML